MAQPKNTNRIEKMNSLIQRLVGSSLPDFLEGQTGLVTVARVETSGDSKWAKVWISIVGGDDDKIFAALNKNIYDIQGDLNRQMGMKMTPRLQFFLDTSPRYVQHIDQLINQIHEEDDGGAGDDDEIAVDTSKEEGEV
jgi:ribosome-binding factor A